MCTETQREANEAELERDHEGTPVTPKDATEHFQRTQDRKIEDTAMQTGRKKPVPRKHAPDPQPLKFLPFSAE